MLALDQVCCTGRTQQAYKLCSAKKRQKWWESMGMTAAGAAERRTRSLDRRARADIGVEVAPVAGGGDEACADDELPEALASRAFRSIGGK
jgi:hypothetical protein